MKKEKNQLLFVSILLTVVFLASMFVVCLPVVSASMSLRITGTINNYSSDLWLKIKTGADGDVDMYDLTSQTLPSEYSTLSSSVSGNSLSIDSWSENPRVLNLTYHMSNAQTGDLNFSWNSNSIDSDLYIVKLKYFGSDSSYTTQVGDDVDMKTSSSYSAPVSGDSDIYVQINISDYAAPEIVLTSPDDEYSVTGEQDITFDFSIPGDLSRITECSLELNSESTTITDIEEDNSITTTVPVGSYSWKVECEEGSRTISSETRSLTVNEQYEEGGGGGGGGRGTPTAQVSNGIVVGSDFLNVKVEKGKTVHRKISISNPGDNIENVSLTVSGLDGILIINESYSLFLLNPGQLVEIPVAIIAPAKEGSYKGKILINNYTILVSVDVSTTELLFDAGVQITKEYSTIVPGGDLKFTTTLIPMGEAGVDVTLNYEIENENGLSVFTKSYTKKIDKQEVIPETFEKLDFPEGKYVLYLELVYPNAIATSSAGFRVKQGEANGLFTLSNFKFILFLVIILIVILLLLIIFVMARNKRLRRKIKIKRKI